MHGKLWKIMFFKLQE